jgi:hypothetical protein
MSRNTDLPVTTNSDGLRRIIYVGNGGITQLSYLFKNNLEVAGRYAITTPYASIFPYQLQREEMGVVLTKYLRKHRVKLQGQVFYFQDLNFISNATIARWTAMFQMEIGI